MQVRACHRTLFVGALAVIALATSPAVACAATSAPTTGSTVQLVVKIEPGAAPAAASAIARDGAAVSSTLAPDTYLVVAHAPNASIAAAQLSHRPGVVYAEPNELYRAASITPNDPCYRGCVQGDQWYLAADRAPAAWGATRGSARVTVAVLDSRVRNHPDLAGKVTNGPDYSDPNDFCGTVEDVDHGTHVAGIIGAVTGNGVGIAGLGWNTRILSIGVLNSTGCGTTASIVKGIHYAGDHHARIINLSLGGPASDAVADAVTYAEQHGVLIVAAAGNEGWSFPDYPAAYPGVISVAATGRNGRIAPFSNRGSTVDIAAPGVEILSTTVDSGIATYSAFDGTSFSTPQVAAVAALLVAENPCMSNDDITTRLETSSRSLPGGGVRSGVLDAGRAVDPPLRGFRVASSDGGVFTRGGECFFGSVSNIGLHAPIVGMTSTTSDAGYWLVGSDGGVFSFGNARYHGSAATLPLVKPIVAMQATPAGRGYWLVASDGGVFSYGDAKFYGSTGGIALHKPVLGMAVTPTGHGYWLVASDGGIFAFGDARFFGSTGALRLDSPVVGMTSSPTGDGYLLVGADGGVFAFGRAQYRGSVKTPGGGATATAAIAITHTGSGYWVLHGDGTVHAFGDATPYGSVPTNRAVAINAARTG